ncbi:Pc16g13390 [Penicillium rubens Wisconsin 54-1255]|uniref:Probable Xaa-Pro aminopeptidase Pc16g13390 n=1 Tax=Penicillium rubens (strain ATCC 28089 / DSM 1075 / NRRL 1951 / Wisconsin 54-1255) TaxID=500485 RepID=AMPP2_PENRW|nr:RecName: Full=Probable Xaa-Pro aminopeptidase Pc16g13390; AltName: Full=Aminoacylproline aminopeptidase; AltName: Full=Prolidase [Penicillium rubens Wisconsin 54-1255]CAP94009.1 Pc16g13390 [Penicillium rubens Wisconsin 54-1255]
MRADSGAQGSAAQDIMINPLDSYNIRVVTPTSCDKYPGRYTSPYSAHRKHHARNVARKLGASSGLIFLSGQPTINLRDSDQSRPFRQRRYFYYLSGVDEPDCSLTYDIEQDLLSLYVPDFDLHRAIWMGPTLSREDAQDRYDVDHVRYHASLKYELQAWLDERKQGSELYLIHDSEKPEHLPKDLPLNLEQLRPAMDTARGVKDEYEIRMIRQANKVSGLAHRRILESIQSMSNESQIEGSFLNTCISHGARNQAYQIIAASGPNAAVLHYDRNNETLNKKPLVCLDAGAEWNCYASDVTRTFPLTGEWPSDYVRDIYKLVERMQDECIRLIRKGTRYLSLHNLAHDIAIEGLLALGVFKNGTIHELRQSGVSKVFFPHGLGHHVGLEVHDVSERSIMAIQRSDELQYRPILNSTCLPPCTLSAPLLEEGMVVTVEPGLYFSPLAMANARHQPYARYIDFDVAEKYVHIGGVRIEDDILVTATGYENLTTAPKGEEMLAIIRGSA